MAQQKNKYDLEFFEYLDIIFENNNKGAIGYGILKHV